MMALKQIAVVIVQLALLALCVGNASANNDIDRYVEALLDRADELALAEDPTWLQLLHYENSPRQGGRSAIVSDDFFLATQGASDPKAELRETLKGFYKPVGDDPNQHATCRFPARLHWLRTRIQFADVPLPFARCDELFKWARFGSLDSVSVISVNGYFGNPASTFGHLLIKLNNSPDATGDELLDTGVNFGAAIPEDESLITYIGRGLFGGYRASFSDKKFYAQYNVYSDSEARDMWEYRLALTHYQERFLVYHLWELVDQEYIYYFLRENCGLRMAEVLEMVLEVDLDADSSGWYLPVTLFHGLEDANDNVGGKLISRVRYIPSKEKEYSTRFRSLDAEQKQYFDNYVANLPAPVSLSEEKEQQTVVALIAFYQYQLAQDRYAKGKEALQEQRRDVIKKLRAKSAQHSLQSAAIQDRAAPTAGSKPSRFGFGAGDVKNGDAFISLRYSAAYFDVIGDNNLDHSELVVMDFTVIANEDEGVELEQLDIISVQELTNNANDYLGGGKWAWRAYVGVNNKFITCQRCRQLELRAGLGKSTSLATSGLGYALIDIGLETENDDVTLTPSVGLILGDSGALKAQLELGRQYFSQTRQDESTVQLQAKYKLMKNHEVRFRYEKNRGEKADVSYQYFW